MRSHDLLSRAIILTHRALSNGHYGVSVRAHWAEVEGKNFEPPGGHFGIKTGEDSFFFIDASAPARRPARPPSRALASMKKNKGRMPPWPYMANIRPVHGQKWTKQKKYGQKLAIYMAIYTDYILPIYRIYTAYYW